MRESGVDAAERVSIDGDGGTVRRVRRLNTLRSRAAQHESLNAFAHEAHVISPLSSARERLPGSSFHPEPAQHQSRSFCHIACMCYALRSSRQGYSSLSRPPRIPSSRSAHRVWCCHGSAVRPVAQRAHPRCRSPLPRDAATAAAAVTLAMLPPAWSVAQLSAVHAPHRTFFGDSSFASTDAETDTERRPAAADRLRDPHSALTPAAAALLPCPALNSALLQ